MATLTLENIITEAFTANEMPAIQPGSRSAFDAEQHEILGTMSVAQANLLHWLAQLDDEKNLLTKGADYLHELPPEIVTEYRLIADKLDRLFNLTWGLIRERFPEGTDTKKFSGMAICDNWQVVAVRLTDEDRQKIEETSGMEDALQQLLRGVLQA